MSTWTHVAAIFRVDRLPFMPRPDWDAVFGRECLFESPSSIWDELEADPGAFMPCGSEGTLRKVIWENPDKSEMAGYAVSVFGDLRDFSDIEGIDVWFQGSCENVEMLREAVVFVECEDGRKLTDSCYMEMADLDGETCPGYIYCKHVWGGEDDE